MKLRWWISTGLFALLTVLEDCSTILHFPHKPEDTLFPIAIVVQRIRTGSKDIGCTEANNGAVVWCPLNKKSEKSHKILEVEQTLANYKPKSFISGKKLRHTTTGLKEVDGMKIFEVF